MRLQRTLVAITTAVTFATVPAVAFGLTLNLGLIDGNGNFIPLRNLDPNTPLPNDGSLLPNGQRRPAEVPDCTIPSGQTSCTATFNIPAGTFATFNILSGGVVKATKTSGAINKVTVSNLTIRYQGSATQRLGILFFHGFSGVNTTIPRGYGQAASGTLCRPDANGNCQTAAGDVVLLNSTVTYAKTNFTQVQSFSLPQSGPYTVPAGGVSNNNYFPQSVLPATSGTFTCPFGGACLNLEIIGSTLTFLIAPGDSIVQKATHFDVSAPNLGIVQNALNAETVGIDIQPIFNLDNNDINLTSNGQRQVAAVSQVDNTTTPPTVRFNPNSIDLSSVLFSVGDGTGVAPMDVSFPGDLNGDGVADIVFGFDIPEIAAANGTCLPGIGGIGVLTGTADFVSTFTTTKKERGQTITETHEQHDTLPFSGQQSFTCAPSAGF